MLTFQLEFENQSIQHFHKIQLFPHCSSEIISIIYTTFRLWRKKRRIIRPTAVAIINSSFNKWSASGFLCLCPRLSSRQNREMLQESIMPACYYSTLSLPLWGKRRKNRLSGGGGGMLRRELESAKLAGRMAR